MRILFLSDGFPYPLISGRLRQYHFVRQLSARHQVTLVSLVPPGHLQTYHNALEPFTQRIETIPAPHLSGTTFQKLEHRALARLSRDRLGSRGDLVRRVRQLHAQEPFDVVLAARVYWPRERHLPGVPVVADQCDAISAAMRGRMRYAGWLERPAVLASVWKNRLDEARMLRTCDHFIVASVRDWNVLASRQQRAMPPATILPNGVDTGYWRRRTRTRPQDSIVFNGSMAHPPNDDAACHLIERILPLVRRARPGAKVRIVGRNPSGRLRAIAARTPDVEVTGYVDDMRPHLENATVAAVPLRFASGVQNKILEAMAMELPVVTTPIADIALRDGRGQSPSVAIAEGEAALAQAIVQRLDSAELDPAPDAAARRWVAREFDWTAIGERLHDLLCAVIEHHDPGTRSAASHRRAFVNRRVTLGAEDR